MNNSMDEKKPGLIRRIYSGLMKFIAGLRMLITNLVFVLILVVLFLAISGGELPTIPERGALVLNIEGSLVDQEDYTDPLSQIMGQSQPEQSQVLLQDVIDAIDYAAKDERITSLVLSLNHFAYGGISKISELSEALQRFRETGKTIIAAGDGYSQDQYLLAAQADEIYINPMGGVNLQGYSVFRSYYKRAIDKLGINFHIFRVGTFKSAMEPFMREDMSEEAREANLLWLTHLWNEYTNIVADRRNLDVADINRYVNEADKLMAEYGGDAAQVAVAQGLVDGIKSRHEINEYLIDAVGAENNDGYFQGIGYRRYLWLKNLESSESDVAEKVGLIVAAGNIMDGMQPPGVIGGDSLAQLIREAKNNENIKALVLRIDSGGGSAFASEIVRRELLLLQEAGKPFVVSMGSVAASGGYWISANADEIWATPTTITGSIGIFGAFPTIEKTLDNIGINTDGVGTTEQAGAFRVDRPMNPIAGSTIQSAIENGYRRFIDLVAEGRGMSTADVEQVAEGRVWSGADAQRLGLVDQLGSLDQAIASAAELAGLDNYDTDLIEIPLSPQEQLLREIMGSENMGAIFGVKRQSQLLSQVQQWFAPFKDHWEFINTMNDPRGVYLHCTVCIAP